ncbi:MAG: GNAT family N-acetyltransferase [Chloroflexi bacterium]|nr:GNAT family N-acetyltransferase [Chloroflexota bacterium]
MIEIRPLRPTDSLDDLIQLSRAFFAEYEAHHPFFKIDVLRDEHLTDRLTSWPADEDKEIFVAVDDGRIVGHITIKMEDQAPFWQVKQIGHISGFMVDPAYRRRGIGGELMAAAKAFFRQKGARFYTVYTAVANRSAVQFYEKHGMIPLHTNFLGDLEEE